MTSVARADGRTLNELRPITTTRGWSNQAEGSALVEFGDTRVLCTASFTEGVPRWLKGEGKGWVTAEYAMLPRATGTRSSRESVKGQIGGRTHEISRLIGRSLRAIIDMNALGENTIVLDCDVLQADGGTRTASITGAYVALADSIAWAQRNGLLSPSDKPLKDSVSEQVRRCLLKQDRAKHSAHHGQTVHPLPYPEPPQISRNQSRPRSCQFQRAHPRYRANQAWEYRR